MLKRKSLEQLIEESLKLCHEHRKFLWQGDYKNANQVVTKKKQLYLTILEFDQDGINALTNLLVHDSPYVRLWAASGLLPYKSDRALEVINHIKVSDEPFISGYAEMILDLWSKGELQFPKSINKGKS